MLTLRGKVKHFMAISAITLLTGCSTPVEKRPLPQTTAITIADSGTLLGRALIKPKKDHPNQSGFHLISTGSEGFRMRMALVRAAEKSLDLQYYGIQDDATSNLMLEAVVRAAQRGVRIRFLLDNSSYSQVSKTLSILDEFKNLEIRVFNPFYAPDQSIATKVVNTLTDLENIERRMHNKVLISDNQMAITGGRNLGDEYFEQNADVAFKDIDILAAGPIVPLMSQSFDAYWNNEKSVPVDQMKAKKATPEEIQAIRKQLSDHWGKTAKTPKGKQILSSTIADKLKTRAYKLFWCTAELAADNPNKIDQEAEDTISYPFQTLKKMVADAKEEFVVISPYFVPRKDGMEWIKSITDRNIRIRVLTNSLASTDVVAVHAGYRPYREELLTYGIELYEMKPIDGKRPRQRLLGKKVPAHASLHAKVYVIDRKKIMIGSFNLDPRSIELNTELTLVLHSPEIAAQVIAMFDEVTKPDTSYHVMRAKDGKGIVWKTREKNKVKYYTREPQAGVWRRIQENALSLLPLEDHL